MIGPAAALVGGQGRQRQAARHRRLDAGAADGLGALQAEEFQRRLRHHLCSATPTTGRRTSRSGIGQNNFDEIRFDYFRDPDVAFEGFKGDQFDWWSENRAKRWATAYDFPAVQDKRVVLGAVPADLRRYAA